MAVHIYNPSTGEAKICEFTSIHVYTKRLPQKQQQNWRRYLLFLFGFERCRFIISSLNIISVDRNFKD